MSEIPLSALGGVLFVLILLSAFFSGSETALMALNRYRLRHLAKTGHRGAILSARLLDRPDRLIGLILLGNNAVNLSASALATVIALRVYGNAGIAIATALLVLVVLIFAEVAPKTLAARHPERIAFPAAFVYTPLLKVLYPLVWVVNVLGHVVLRLLGQGGVRGPTDTLEPEELRTLVNETGVLIPKRHQRMLVNILDLEKITVNDIMVPRNEIDGIDLDDDWEDIVEQIGSSAHGRIPVFRDDIGNVVGMLHLRRLVATALRGDLRPETLEAHITEPYFIPEGTSLTRQLLNFQQHKQRIGLVVDEYGDILGLAALEDILEEIVGEFTTVRITTSRDIRPQDDGTYIVDGGTQVRELNRAFTWNLPTSGPRTLNGLILEHLEIIPESGTTFLLQNHPVEILQTKGNVVKSVRIHPAVRPRPGHTAQVAEDRSESAD